MKSPSLFTAIAALLIIAGCSAANNTIDATALLEERCGTCHSFDLPKNARKSRSDWEETVTRMIAKGAKLSTDEKKALVKHLAKIYRP